MNDQIKIGDLVLLDYKRDSKNNVYQCYYIIVGLKKSEKRNAIELFPQIYLDLRDSFNEQEITTFLEHNQSCDTNKTTCMCFTQRYFYWFNLIFKT